MAAMVAAAVKGDRQARARWMRYCTAARGIVPGDQSHSGEVGTGAHGFDRPRNTPALTELAEPLRPQLERALRQSGALR